MQGSCPIPRFCRSGSRVLSFLCLTVRKASRPHMQAVVFGPLEFLCTLLLENTFVQVREWPQKVPSPSRFQKDKYCVNLKCGS